LIDDGLFAEIPEEWILAFAALLAAVLGGKPGRPECQNWAWGIV
jgi:hypothetical protein